jgi:toxin ParE1/3/4
VSKDNFRPRDISFRPQAIEDIEQHALYLEENAPPDIALRFRTAIMAGVDQISRMPSGGSPREVRNPMLAGLRMWIVPEFRNYLVFYLTPVGTVEIVRVFHGARDIETILEDSAD